MGEGLMAGRLRKGIGWGALVLFAGLIGLRWWGSGSSQRRDSASGSAPEAPHAKRRINHLPTPHPRQDHGASGREEHPSEDPWIDDLASDEFEDDVGVAQVEVDLVYPNGATIDDLAVVTSMDCRQFAEARGGTVTLSIPVADERTCTLDAWRMDGRLRAVSDDVELRIKPWETYRVQLVLPQERTGGLGVVIGPHEEGIAVQNVVPGTPAHDMGLSQGDVIVEVDGLPVSTLTMHEFIQVMTGPVGTEVDFVVGYIVDTGWTEEDLTLKRAFLDEP